MAYQRRNFSSLTRNSDVFDEIEVEGRTYKIPATMGSNYWAILKVMYSHLNQPVYPDQLVRDVDELMNDYMPESWEVFRAKQTVLVWSAIKQKTEEQKSRGWQDRVVLNAKNLTRVNDYGIRLYERGHSLCWELDENGKHYLILRDRHPTPEERGRRGRLRKKKPLAPVVRVVKPRKRYSHFRAALNRAFTRFANRGMFALLPGESINEAVKRHNVSNLFGIYVIFGSDDLEVPIYIGKAGTINSDGSWKAQGISGRLTMKQDGVYREAFFRDLMSNEKLSGLTFFWFVTHGGSVSVVPALAEMELLQAFYDEYRRLPRLNRCV
jgi:hypothetical protein